MSVALIYETTMNGVCPYVYSPGQTWTLASLDGTDHPRGFQRNLHFSSQTSIMGSVAIKDLAQKRGISEEEASKAMSQIKVKFWRGIPPTNHSNSSSYINDAVNINVMMMLPCLATPIKISIGTNCKVEELKEAIKHKVGLGRDEQKLLITGRELLNGNTLAHYGIKDNDTINVMARFRHGAISTSQTRESSRHDHSIRDCSRRPYSRDKLLHETRRTPLTREEDLEDIGTPGAIVSTQRVVEGIELTDLDIDFDFDVLPFIIELRMDPRHETT